MTTLGDTIYGGVGGTPTQLVGQTTTNVDCYLQQGTGTVSAPPYWGPCSGGTSAFTLTTLGSSGPATYTGGVLNIPSYSGGGGGGSGTPIYIAPQLTSGNSSFAGYSFLARLHGVQFTTTPTSGGWKVALYTLSGTETIGSAVILRTLPFSAVVIDSTPVTFITNGDTISGFGYSDAIPLAIDRAHDYVLVVYIASGSADAVGQPCTGGAETTYQNGDHTTDTSTFVLGSGACDFYGAYVF
jgi:hypothetical protein